MKYKWIIFLLLIVSCNYKRQILCSEGFKELNLYPVNTTLNIPPFIITDSVIYGGMNKILSYKIKSIDTSFSVYVFIDNHEKDVSLDLNHIATVQKGEVESGRNSKKIIKELFKNIGDIKVGYLKYFIEQENKKFYAGRVFFYREKKLVVCWFFENYIDEIHNNESVIDCVFENIKIN